MTFRKTLTVAAAQYPIGEPKSLAEWEEKVAKWVAEGAHGGAELLIFPEYAAMEQAAIFGLEVASDLRRSLAKVAELAGKRVAFHAELARQHGVHILVGSGPVLGDDDRYLNAAQLVTPDGNVGEQTKLMMTPFERDWGISAGGPARVFETALGRIGIAICYDSEFPLIARSMAAAGAELLLVPSCTEFVSGYHRVRTGSLARALENQMACVTSPTIGDAPWSPAVDRNNGAAGIFVPSEHGVSDTGVLAEGGLNSPAWVTATIDFEGLRRLRSAGEMRNYVDWPLQPGAQEGSSTVEVIRLV